MVFITINTKTFLGERNLIFSFTDPPTLLFPNLFKKIKMK